MRPRYAEDLGRGRGVLVCRYCPVATPTQLSPSPRLFPYQIALRALGGVAPACRRRPTCSHAPIAFDSLSSFRSGYPQPDGRGPSAVSAVVASVSLMIVIIAWCSGLDGPSSGELTYLRAQCPWTMVWDKGMDANQCLNSTATPAHAHYILDRHRGRLRLTRSATMGRAMGRRAWTTTRTSKGLIRALPHPAGRRLYHGRVLHEDGQHQLPLHGERRYSTQTTTSIRTSTSC